MNSSPSLLLIVLLFAPCLISSVQCQLHACNESHFFTTNHKNITQCKKLPTLGFELGWRYHNTSSENVTLDVVFSAKPPKPRGWVAWGVNPQRPQMIGTRALIAFVQANGTPVVRTYNLTKETKTGCYLKSRPLEVEIVNARAEYTAGTGVITVAATLILPTLAYNVSRLNHVWQVGPWVVEGEIPVVHRKELENFDSRETIDLTSGRTIGHRHQHLRVAHGVLGVIGWGILLPVGAIFSRYFKGFPFHLNRWFLLHIGIQIMAFTIGTIAWGIGISLGNNSEHYKVFMAHRIIGILVFVLASLQMMALWLKPSKQDSYRKYWSIYHHFIGYALVGLTITNIFKGLAILKPPPRWTMSYIGILASLSGVIFLMEVATWVKFCCLHKKPDNTIANNDDQTKPPTPDNTIANKDDQTNHRQQRHRFLLNRGF